jgi:MarR family transcriptional regulator, transcriptional regulator for hemolysin
MTSDWETFGPLLHGTARAWRQKLDERLKPMGLSQAKWRTLLHLSLAGNDLTQAEIAARLGVEEPSVVTLLHRLEKEGWIVRRNSSHDRRCKMVNLGRRTQRVIGKINATADELRHELLTEIPAPELQTCIKVLAHIRAKAEKSDKLRRAETPSVFPGDDGQNRDGQPITKKKALNRARGVSQ